jgi:DNA primase
MRFPPQFLDELRARLPVSEVVGKHVRLKKAGREWKGLSPFNKERTPSFCVSDEKGLYHDFSSGKHGDIFTFTMEMEGLTFPEAVERLAALAGLAMPQCLAGIDPIARQCCPLLPAGPVVDFAGAFGKLKGVLVPSGV